MVNAAWGDPQATWGTPASTWTGLAAPPRPIPLAALRRSAPGGPVLLSHPFRLDAGGAIATMSQGSPRHATEAAGHVLSCLPGERPLAPHYGYDEPVGGYTEPDSVAAALVACEPDLQPDSVEVEPGADDGTVRILADVAWAQS